jgi:5'-methylthioadenosine phosphorylase
VHRGGTYVCIEGPQFSTLAEALVNRSLHFDVVGMTNATEARLAREAEICYGGLAMITDYDCWHPAHSSVTLEEIISNLNKNAENAQAVVREAVRKMPATRSCKCGSALSHAIVTDPSVIPAATRKRLQPIAGKYISPGAR